MTHQHSLPRAILCLFIVLSILPLFSCGGCKNAAPLIYVVADDVETEIKLDLSQYEESPTVYDVLTTDETLEADVDKTTNPDTIRSVCNTQADVGECFVLYSSDPADAPEGVEPIKYKRQKFYRVGDNFLSVSVKSGTRYLLRLESES